MTICTHPDTSYSPTIAACVECPETNPLPSSRTGDRRPVRQKERPAATRVPPPTYAQKEAKDDSAINPTSTSRLGYQPHAQLTHRES